MIHAIIEQLSAIREDWNIWTEINLYVRRILKASVIWAFLVIILRGAGFFLVMAYALRKLPSSEIGLWYVMLNIAGLANIVEFGFNPTIGRFASYFMGGAASVPRLGLNQRPGNGLGQPNYRAVAGLVIMSRSLYVRFGIFVMLAMLLGGGGWLAYKAAQLPLTWINGIAFVGLAIGSGLNMMGLFWQGLQFGINRVRAYNQFFILSLLASYGVSFSGLVAGLGLTALVLGFLVLNFLCRWLARWDVLSIISADAFTDPQPTTWRELWPMTWRSGLTSLASFLCIQNTTLICSFIADLNTTASYGLSLQLALIVHAFSANWLSVKFPEISSLRIQRAMREVVGIVGKRMLLSLITFIAGAVVTIIAAPLVLAYVHSNTQVLPSGQMSALFIIIGLDLIIGMHAAIMQTGNQVPHLTPFIISGILVTLLGWVLGRRYGVYGIIAAIPLAQIFYNYWWTPWRCWRDIRSNASKIKTETEYRLVNSLR